jgi:hypothetical protein
MKHLIAAWAAACALVLAGCSDDHDHDHDHDHDVINRVVLTVSAEGEAERSFMWEDADGDGGNNPNRIDTVKLSANKIYTGTVSVFKTLETPSEDLTGTIRTDGKEHQFFYTVSNGIVTVEYADQDERGRPLGLAIRLTTTGASTGSLQIELQHFDNENDKTGTNRSDETDVNITLPVVVQ